MHHAALMHRLANTQSKMGVQEEQRESDSFNRWSGTDTGSSFSFGGGKSGARDATRFVANGEKIYLKEGSFGSIGSSSWGGFGKSSLIDNVSSFGQNNIGGMFGIGTSGGILDS